MKWFKKEQKRSNVVETIELTKDQAALVIDNNGKSQLYIPRQNVEDVDTLTDSETLMISIAGLIQNPAFAESCKDQMISNLKKKMDDM
jgi:hypothetical protein